MITIGYLLLSNPLMSPILNFTIFEFGTVLMYDFVRFLDFLVYGLAYLFEYAEPFLSAIVIRTLTL